METSNLSFKNAVSNDLNQDLLQLSIIASANENGVVFNDAEGTIFWVNESYCKLLGYSADEIIGRNPLDFCRGPYTDEAVIQAVSRSIGKKGTFAEELIHYRKDGSWFWGRVKGQAYRIGQGDDVRCFSTVEDITLEKQKEDKLEILSRIAEENINAVILTDRRGRITWVNKSFAKITGYTLKEVAGKKPGHFLQGPETDKQTVAYLKEKINNAEPFNAELLNYSKDGVAYWIRIQGQPINNAKGELIGFFAIQENVTNEKYIADKLKESEARFRLALEKIGDNVWEYNFKTGKTIFSKTNNTFGFLTHKIGKSEMVWWDVVNRDDLRHLRETFLSYRAGLIDSHSLEYRVIDADGAVKWILDRGVVIENDQDGKPLRITGTHTDITKIKQTETELEQRVKQFKSLSENSPGVIYEYEFKADGSEGLRYISPAMERVFGIKPEEFTDEAKYIPEEDRERIRRKNEHCKNTLEPFYDESPLIIPGVGVKWRAVQSSFSYVSQTGAKVFTGIMNDITERKNVEVTLKANESKYRSIIANMNLGLLEVDNSENITFANNSFCEMSGYRAEELLGKNARELFARGESREVLEEKEQMRKSGKADAYELKLYNKAGKEKWWLISGAPRYNDKGELVGSIGIHLDITEQKNQEIELIKAKKHAEHLAQSQEIFLANMSHEIRTPMNAIMGMTNQLSKTVMAPQQQFFLEVIQSASESLLIIINDILDLSKIEAGKLNIENIGFELKKSANRVLQVLEHKAEEKGIALRVPFYDEAISPVLIGDPYRLNQILLNLINNAIKFTDFGFVELSFQLIDQTDEWQHIQIKVDDTGVGMDKAFLKHLFDKFSQESKSISRKYGGTGLGMSICKDLIELMGGNIHVESKKNEGTRVILDLKLKKGLNTDLPEKDNFQFSESLLKDKSFLVTDDNELNRLVASVILQNYGALVSEAMNGNVAIELIKKKSFDIILMDIQMPGINGFEATRRIRESGNNTPIIALTAEAIKGEREKCLAAGMNDYITKPINEEEFLKTLDKWLKKSKRSENNILTNMTNEMLYDLSSLKAISKGNESFVNKMVTIFCEQTPPMCAEMEMAYRDGDFDKMRALAHKMKPSIDNLNIVAAKQLVRDVENEKMQHELKPGHFDLINKTIAKAIESLKIEYPSES